MEVTTAQSFLLPKVLSTAFKVKTALQVKTAPQVTTAGYMFLLLRVSTAKSVSTAINLRLL